MVEAIRQGDIPGVQLRCRRPLPIPPQEAWSWLTETRLLERWLAIRVEVEPGPRGSLRLEDVEAGEPVEETADTLDIQPTERWVLAFRRASDGWPEATLLTLELAPLDEGCELSVLHEGFEHLPLSDCLTIWESYRKRWRGALERLAEAVGR